METSSRALEAWLNWLGLPPEEGPRLLKKESIEMEMRRLQRALFHPPGENTIDPLAARERATVDRAFGSLAERIGVRPEPFWPEGRPYVLCVTHDIDRILSTVQRFGRHPGSLLGALGVLAKDSITAMIPKLRERNAYFNFQRIRALEKEWGIRSASYVLFEKRRPLKSIKLGEPQHSIGVYSPKQIYPELIQYVRDGNEVGLHASFDSWKSEPQLREELGFLAAAGIGPVTGVRSHYLNFDSELSPAAQSAAGLKYDSTMGYNFKVGFRSGTCFPYHLGPMLEIPFQVMDSSSRFQYPHFIERKMVVRRIQEEVARVGGVLVVNWHTHVMNQAAFPREMELLESIIKQAKAAGAWIALPGEVAEHWNSRRARALKDAKPRKVKASKTAETPSDAVL